MEWGFSMVKDPADTFRNADFTQMLVRYYTEFLTGLMRDDDAYLGVLFEYLVAQLRNQFNTFS